MLRHILCFFVYFSQKPSLNVSLFWRVPLLTIRVVQRSLLTICLTTWDSSPILGFSEREPSEHLPITHYPPLCSLQFFFPHLYRRFFSKFLNTPIIIHLSLVVVTAEGIFFPARHGPTAALAPKRRLAAPQKEGPKWRCKSYNDSRIASATHIHTLAQSSSVADGGKNAILFSY